MSWTDGEVHVATAELCGLRWNGGRPGENFRCYMCGHRFKPGDTFRFQHTPDLPGNPLICQQCDMGSELNRTGWRLKHRDWKERIAKPWWWFIRNENNRAIQEYENER